MVMSRQIKRENPGFNLKKLMNAGGSTEERFQMELL